ncbi:MAG: hypothetical protein ABXS93_05955 [Sulfurimonas sp.]
MDLLFIIKSLVGLVLLLGVLIALLLYKPHKKQKKTEQKEVVKKDSDYTFAELVAVIKHQDSTTEELKWALDVIVKYHDKIDPKHGVRVSDDFYRYSEIILRLCKHPNTKKELIIRFDSALRKANPEYAKELNDSLTKRLNSRAA